MLFSKDNPEYDLPAPKDEAHWAALLRGQIIATTTDKFVTYVNLADQKAQAMIILNSILIPVVIGWIGKPLFQISASISILAGIASILAAMLCIYPKRRRGHKPDGTFNLLHFGDVGRMSERRYLDLMYPVFNDLNELSQMAIKDLHDIAKRIIIPKFFWLKMSYSCFFVGNLLAIGWTVILMWSGLDVSAAIPLLETKP